MVAQLDRDLSDNYEAKTQVIAKELIEATRNKGSFMAALQNQMRWDDKLLAWTMSNPNLRVQLFRFIDTLPALRSKPEIARHLQEYVGDDSVELPSTLKGLLNFADANSAPAQLAATTMIKGVETLAFKYIAGETVDQVIRAVKNSAKIIWALLLTCWEKRSLRKARLKLTLRSI